MLDSQMAQDLLSLFNFKRRTFKNIW